MEPPAELDAVGRNIFRNAVASASSRARAVELLSDSIVSLISSEGTFVASGGRMAEAPSLEEARSKLRMMLIVLDGVKQASGPEDTYDRQELERVLELGRGWEQSS